jgi:Tol biopolymer transport system component
MRGFRGNWRLVVAPVSDLAKGRALTPPDASCHSPRWSPDGRRVCYTGYRVGDPGWCVYVQDVATGAATRVCEGRNPCFSPDGKTLLYDRDGSLFTRPMEEVRK